MPSEGVPYYTCVTICFDEYFPKDEVCCLYCRFCKYDSNFHTYMCNITSEYIKFADLKGNGNLCPIVKAKE